jgi:MerR family transcriptional regulator, light-induced transcriptional regulator
LRGGASAISKGHTVDLFLREDGLDESINSGQFGTSVVDGHCLRVASDQPRVGRVHAVTAVDELLQASVLPAIARAYRPATRHQEVGGTHWRPDNRAKKEFADAVLSGNLHEARTLIARYRSLGMRIEQLYLELLEPAARLYGIGWASDDCDFTEVTVGCWRLQQLMYTYGDDFHNEVRLQASHSACIWLSAVPGEQHTFGVSMVREFLIRAGHQVLGMPCATASVVLETVKREHLDVIGFSIASDVMYERARQLIESVRSCSRNQAVRVLIGGPALLGNYELCAKLGADAWAKSAHEALSIIDSWSVASVV